MRRFDARSSNGRILPLCRVQPLYPDCFTEHLAKANLIVDGSCGCVRLVDRQDDSLAALFACSLKRVTDQMFPKTSASSLGDQRHVNEFADGVGWVGDRRMCVTVTCHHETTDVVSGAIFDVKPTRRIKGRGDSISLEYLERCTKPREIWTVEGCVIGAFYQVGETVDRVRGTPIDWRETKIVIVVLVRLNSAFDALFLAVLLIGWI